MPSQYHLKPKPPPDDHPEFFDSDRLPEGWELLMIEEHDKKPNYTGERVARDKQRYQAVIKALASGAPKDWICKAFHIHSMTLAAIAMREKTVIEEEKRSAGELMLKAARWSVESYVEDLMAGKVDPKTKSISAGIYSQNGSLLLGQATSIVAHQGKSELAVDRVKGFWDRVMRANGGQPVVDVEVLSTDGPSTGLSQQSNESGEPEASVPALVPPPEPESPLLPAEAQAVATPDPAGESDPPAAGVAPGPDRGGGSGPEGADGPPMGSRE